MARIVILGGGVGGVVVARELRKRLPAAHRITIVERDPVVSFPPSYLWVMTGDRRPGQIKRDLRRLQRHGIEVLPATVTGIDPNARRVLTDNGAEAYDYLVVALGAELAPGAVPGLAEAGYNLYRLEGAVALRDALRGFSGGTLAIAVASLPYKCPAAPYEAAMLLEAYCRRRGIRKDVTIHLSAPEAAPMPVAGPRIGAQVTRLLHERGIDYFPQSQLQSVDPAARRLLFADGSARSHDLLVAIPPHRPPVALTGSGMVNEAGWATVDPHTLETAVPDHFALGDATAIPLPNGMLLPKAGVFAHHEAEAVARTLAHRIAGRDGPGRFNGDGSCFLEVGAGRAGYVGGNFYAPPGKPLSLRGPSPLWHWDKLWFERYWLWRWY